MPDKESVSARLESLDQYLSELDYYTRYSHEDMVNDFVIYRVVQHSLQLAVQVTIDIATHIITADFCSRVE